MYFGMFSFSLLNLDSWAGFPLIYFASSLLALLAFLVTPFAASFLDEVETDESRFSCFFPLGFDFPYYLRVIIFDDVAIEHGSLLPGSARPSYISHSCFKLSVSVAISLLYFKETAILLDASKVISVCTSFSAPESWNYS